MTRPGEAMAFGGPGDEARGAKAAPIDLSHLARQTMDDRALQQEVLALFVQQAVLMKEQIGGADTQERLRLAHSLKGSARSVGAFGLADCAAEIEKAPGDPATISRLAELIDEIRDFVASAGS